MTTTISQRSPIARPVLPSFCIGIPIQPVCITNCEGHIFSVIPVTSLEALEETSQKVGKDFRIVVEDTEKSLSCLKGIALDPNFTRAQMFSIHDGLSCIGVATLFAIPSRNQADDTYFKKIEGKLVAQPFSEVFPSRPGSFVIETGGMRILPPYRNKKLGEAITTQVLIPVIQKLCASTHEQVIVRCNPQGNSSQSLREKMSQICKERFREISISSEIASCLGQTYPESLFSLHQSMKQLGCLPDVFNFTLGPVFAKTISQ